MDAPTPEPLSDNTCASNCIPGRYRRPGSTLVHEVFLDEPGLTGGEFGGKWHCLYFEQKPDGCHTATNLSNRAVRPRRIAGRFRSRSDSGVQRSARARTRWRTADGGKRWYMLLHLLAHPTHNRYPRIPIQYLQTVVAIAPRRESRRAFTLLQLPATQCGPVSRSHRSRCRRLETKTEHRRRFPWDLAGCESRYRP